MSSPASLTGIGEGTRNEVVRVNFLIIPILQGKNRPLPSPASEEKDDQSGFNFASMLARFASKNGGRDSVSPSLSIGSSA